jgi:hypothetical protein
VSDQPPLGAILCAGTAAAFAAVTPMALLLGLATMNLWVFLSAYMLGVPIALVPSWMLGLPAYFVLRERSALTWAWAASGGFVVGGLPAGLLSLALSRDPLVGLGLLLWVGLLGACGGLAFRAYLGFLE